MLNEIIPAGSQWLPVSVLGAFISAILLGVTAWRKWRSGDLDDDERLIQRMYKEIDRLNMELERKHERARIRDEEIDMLRLKIRHLEDVAAVYYRQLVKEGHQPEEII